MRILTLASGRGLSVSSFIYCIQASRPSFLALNSSSHSNSYNLNQKKITSPFFHSRFYISTPSNVQDSRPKNENIQSLQVNLISETGEKQGIFPLSQVLSEMNQKDQVLIQVSEDEPPFCKIYSKKALYEKSKADVKKKFKSTVSSKIFKFASNISPHDLQVKVNQCKKKLEKGDVIKFILTVPRNTPPEKIQSLVLPIYEDLYEKLEESGKISEVFTVKEGSGSFTLCGDKKDV